MSAGGLLTTPNDGPTEATSWALSHLPQMDDDQAEGRVHLSAVREKEEAGRACAWQSVGGVSL